MNRPKWSILVPVLCLALAGPGCRDDGDVIDDPAYLPQTSEDNVLENFQRSYRNRDIAAYSRLLASDFQFYFEATSREQLGIEFWTRTSDSLSTQAFFEAPAVISIDIDLKWPRGSATSVGSLQPCPLSQIRLTDVHLDVEFAIGQEDTTTYRIENQPQEFTFRRGRTCPPSGPADTLVYIVKWVDFGASLAPARASVETATWSLVKARVRWGRKVIAH